MLLLASFLFANDFRVELLLLLALVTRFAAAALSATKRATVKPTGDVFVTYFGPAADFCWVDDADEP